MLSAQEIFTLRSADMWRVNRMTPGLGLVAPLRSLTGSERFYEKVIKVKADVAAYLINCFPSA